MGKSSPSAPQVPDPVKTANAQGAANKDAAIATAKINMVNQKSPYGTVNYTQNPNSGTGAGSDVPTYTQTTTLDPSQQRQLDSSNALKESSLALGQGEVGNIANAVKDPFSLSGMPAAGQYSTLGFPALQDKLDLSGVPSMMNTADMGAERQRIEKNLFDRLNPQLDRQQGQMENKLTNQGIALGSEAWKNAQDDQARNADDLRLAASNQAGQEVNNQFNQSLAGRQNAVNELNNQGTFANTARGQASNEALTNANFDNSTRDRAISEAALQRSQPINELAALLGTSGGVQQPGGANTQGVAVQPADIAGSTWNSYNAQLAQQQAAQQRSQSGINNIFGLAGTLGSAAILSDRRLKHAINKIGEWFNGLPVYEFIYNDDPDKIVRTGFMADEVEKLHPHAVMVMDNGFKAVDYRRAIK